MPYSAVPYITRNGIAQRCPWTLNRPATQRELSFELSDGFHDKGRKGSELRPIFRLAGSLVQASPADKQIPTPPFPRSQIDAPFKEHSIGDGLPAPPTLVHSHAGVACSLSCSSWAQDVRTPVGEPPLPN